MNDDPHPYGVDHLGDAGRALYFDIFDSHGHYLGLHELGLLLEAARTCDRIQRLHHAADSETNEYARLEMPSGVTVVLKAKEPDKLTYAAVRSMHALITALRLRDPKTGRRPQRRPPRGFYTRS